MLEAGDRLRSGRLMLKRAFPRWLGRFTMASVVGLFVGGARLAAEAPDEPGAADRAWVAAHPKIRVGFDPTWAPFSSVARNGGCVGIDADLLALLARRTGLRFEFTTRASWSEVYAAAKRGEIDLLVGTARTAERAESFGFTGPYLSFPVVIVTRNQEPILWSVLDLAGRRVVGVRDYAPTVELSRQHPELRLLTAETVQQAMQQVSDGEADACITNLPNASFVAKTRGLTNLKIAGVLPERFDLRYAVRRDWPELVALLDRAIAGVTEADRQAVLHPWVRVDYEKIIRWDLVWKTAAIVLSVLGVILGAVIYHNRRLARELVERGRLARQLAEEHEKLVRLNEDKTELLQMAAHDLRGPLTGMQLAIDASLRLNAVPMDQALAIVERQVKQMTGLLNDLLDVEALEHGRREFRIERVDPAAKLWEAIAVATPVARAKAIRLEPRVAEPIPAVEADATALKQIIDNLLSNALKFAPRDSTVRVMLERRAEFVCLEVRDEGPGVRPEETERIFAKYVRGSARPTEGEKSTGLGLSIVRQLAGAMNGRVWCEHQTGGGGFFVLKVPVARAVL